MRKIRLEIDDLTVESFDTAGSKGQKAGTVHGNAYSQWEGCIISDGISACATCDGGCPADTRTCFASCRMTNGYAACIDNNCG
jgi:hypothetical protein